MFVWLLCCIAPPSLSFSICVLCQRRHRTCFISTHVFVSVLHADPFSRVHLNFLVSFCTSVQSPPFCRQNTFSHDMFEHVQLIRSVCSHAHLTHHVNTRGSRLCTPGLRIGISEIVNHPSVMSHQLQHLSLSTSTRSSSRLPHRSSDLLPHCPVLWNWINTPCEIHGGVADLLKSPSPTGYEPKVIQSDDLELGRNLVDRSVSNTRNNSGRSLSKSYHRRYGGDWKFWCRDAPLPIKDALRSRFS